MVFAGTELNPGTKNTIRFRPRNRTSNRWFFPVRPQEFCIPRIQAFPARLPLPAMNFLRESASLTRPRSRQAPCLEKLLAVPERPACAQGLACITHPSKRSPSASLPRTLLTEPPTAVPHHRPLPILL